VHQSPPQFFNDDASRDTQTTVRDDHGNRLPPNAKAILGFRKKSTNNLAANGAAAAADSNNQNTHTNDTFPSLPNVSSYQSHNQTKDEMEKRLRDLAGQLNHEWRTGATTFIASPALARRLRDFQFAREKRRKKYGIVKPWGILGLYYHLSGVRIDVEWAEDAAWRRMNGKPYLTWGDFETLKSTGNNRPFFTYTVVSFCTAMMFAAWFVNGWHFEPLSVNPMIGPSAETLLRLGAKDSYLIVQEQEIWRLVSPMVLHAGLIHYILNKFALWYVGKAIELIHGHFHVVSALPWR
jgi:membrane associated rhomboid family serine protease